MRKIILIGLLAASIAFAPRIEQADLGVNYLIDEWRADISADTIVPAETLFTATYSVDNVVGMSSNTSMFIKIDSCVDSTWAVIKLQESWDEGATWEFTTTECSLYTVAAYIDTGFDVDLFPCPYFRFLIINIAGTDSFIVEDAIFYNHPR